MQRTIDPIADMEESQMDRRPLLGYCEVCGQEIHGSMPGWYADEAYCINGEYVCRDHLEDYFIDNKIE
jgi:hypothetical protein